MANLRGSSTINGFPIVGKAGNDSYIAKLNKDNTLVNSLLYENATGIGVGNTNPTQKLEVTGNIKATSFIGSLDWTNIASKPTTLSGYGITDAAASSHTHSNATASVAGFMSPTDKTKLDGISGTGGLDTVAGDARYLQLTGGTMTGDLSVSKNTPRINLTNTAGAVSRIEQNENGNLWANVAGGYDFWINWLSPSNSANYADLAVGNGNSGSAILFVQGSTNRVGVNNNSPSYALDVIGTGRFSDTLLAGREGGNIRLASTGYDGGIWTSANKLIMGNWNATSNALTVDMSNGSVGIGTQSPTNAKLHLSGGSAWTANGWGKSLKLDGAVQFTGPSTHYGLGNSGDYLYMWTTSTDTSAGDSSNYKMIMNGSGNVRFGGGGNTPSSYRMHVEGDVYADGGWLRVSGQNGIFFESYSGGWYMTDSTYLRSYGNKTIYTGGVVRGDGGYHLQNGSTSISNGNTYAARLQTPYGYIDFGPQNSSYAHFNTDRPYFYFSTGIQYENTLKPYGVSGRFILPVGTNMWG